MIVDTNGNVESAQAISGHLLLREAAEKAARSSRFVPPNLNKMPVKTNGVMVYNFVFDKSFVTESKPPEDKNITSPLKSTMKSFPKRRIKKRLTKH